MQAPNPVLATLSGSYPEVKGRSLTCYSPVRRSSTPEGAFPLDLHVLSTPPAFVLSQDQTLRESLVAVAEVAITGYGVDPADVSIRCPKARQSTRPLVSHRPQRPALGLK